MNKPIFRMNIIFIIMILITISIIYFYQNNIYNNIVEDRKNMEIIQSNSIKDTLNNNIFFLNNVYAENNLLQESFSIPITTFALTSNTSRTNQTQSHFTVQIPFGAGKPANLFEYYTPSSIHIKKGDSITWINNDAVSHTVTAARLNSGLIWPQESKEGKSDFSHTFDQSGIFSYFCQIHPYMSGTVYVDVEETQRQLISTIDDNKVNVIVEMPMGTAYENYYNHYFIPANAFVQVGGTITWINNDYVPHTATAADNSFDTKTIDPFGSKSLVFTNEGRIAYYCKIHPWMQASITVTSK
jgi:plastocyanin